MHAPYGFIEPYTRVQELQRIHSLELKNGSVAFEFRLELQDH